MRVPDTLRWFSTHGLARMVLRREASRGNLNARLLTDPVLRANPFPYLEQLRAEYPFTSALTGKLTVHHDIATEVLRAEQASRDAAVTAEVERLRRLGCNGAASLDTDLSQAWYDCATRRIDAMRSVEDLLAVHLRRLCESRIAQARAELYYKKLDAEQKAAMQKKKVRYIAVDTHKDDKIQGQKAVMIYDTKSQQIVGNDVYDVKQAPKVGQTTKLDNYTAQYVGSGT